MTKIEWGFLATVTEFHPDILGKLFSFFVGVEPFAFFFVGLALDFLWFPAIGAELGSIGVALTARVVANTGFGLRAASKAMASILMPKTA